MDIFSHTVSQKIPVIFTQNVWEIACVVCISKSERIYLHTIVYNNKQLWYKVCILHFNLILIKETVLHEFNWTTSATVWLFDFFKRNCSICDLGTPLTKNFYIGTFQSCTKSGKRLGSVRVANMVHGIVNIDGTKYIFYSFCG